MSSLPCACTTVRKADRALFRVYDAALSGSGLTIIQFSILRNLERSGETPLSRLAEKLMMERTSLYRTIKPLQDDGLVKIVAAPRGREKLAELTPEGHARLADALPRWAQIQGQVIDRIGANEWKAMSALFATLPALLKDLT